MANKASGDATEKFTILDTSISVDDKDEGGNDSVMMTEDQRVWSPLSSHSRRLFHPHRPGRLTDRQGVNLSVWSPLALFAI